MGLKAVTGRGAAAASGANTFGKNVGSEVRGSASNLSQAEIDMAHSVGLEPTMYDIAGPKGRKAFDQAAANSPDARVVADKMASDMADRAANAKQIVGDHIEGLNGRPLDSASRQAAIEAQGDIQNSANYGAARAHPNAADMSHQGLHDLADNSPALRDAITKAEEAAKEVLPIDKATGLPDQSRKIIPRSAATPDTQVPSSIIGPDGKPVMKTIPGTPAVGGNLNFWHNVKMNLDNQIQNAVRSADKPVISQLMGVKERLLNQMDAAIPEYQTARNAAAETFGASNAIEAGHNSMGLAKKAFNVPDMNINYSSMTPEQKSLFREGMLGHMHDIATKDGPAGVAKLLNDPNVAKHVKNVLGEPVFNHIKNHSDILQKLIKTKAPASEGVLSPTVKHEAGKWGIGAGGIGEAIALMHGLPLTGLAAGAAGAMGRKGFELLKDAKIRREAKRIAPEAAMSHPATVRQYVHDAATKAPRGLASRAAGLPGKAAPYVTPAYQAGKTEEVNPEYQRGGAVSGHQHLVDRLFSEVEKARKAEKGRTSVLLRQPDEHIAKALNMAQAAI
jgi:hypothetical protein